MILALDIHLLINDLIETSEIIKTTKMCESAEEAKKLLENYEFDCIVSDGTLPGQDGVDFLEECARICPDSSRLLLTGNLREDLLKKAINKGKVQKVIFKPWENKELLDSLEEWVAKKDADFERKDWHINQEDGEEDDKPGAEAA